MSFVGEMRTTSHVAPARPPRGRGERQADEVEDGAHAAPRIAGCPERVSSCSTPLVPAPCQMPTNSATRLGHARQRRTGGQRPRLPTSRLGLGNVEARGAPAGQRTRGRAADRALEGQGHDARPLGADGDRHAAGPADISARIPHDVIDPFMHRTARGVLGNKPASGTEIIQELGEEHQETGKWIVYTSADSVFQVAAHEETIPLELYEAAGTPARSSPASMRSGACRRPFIGDPRNYERTPNRHDFSLEPTAELPDAAARGRSRPASEDRRHLRRPGHRREPSDEVERGGITKTEAAPTLDEASCSSTWSNGHALGSPERPNQLPPLPAELRPAPVRSPGRARRGLLIVTSDHGCDPTTPSTDHSREHAAARLVHGKNANGRIHEGVRRRRRDGEHLARQEGARPPASGPADRRTVSA